MAATDQRRDRQHMAMPAVRDAVQFCSRREHLRRTVRIALVVGTILTAINQADVILGGEPTVATWIKAALNYCVPFVVANLGMLAGRTTQSEGES